MNLSVFRKRSERNRTLFLRIQIFSSLLLLAAVLLLGAAFYRSAYDSFLANASASGIGALRSVRVSVENVFKNIIDVASQTYVDTKLRGILIRGASDSYEDRKYLDDKMQQIKASSRFIHSAYLLIIRQRLVVSTEHGFLGVEDFPDASLEAWASARGPAIEIFDTRPVGISAQSSESQVITVAARLPLDGSDGFLGVLFINIDQATIAREVMTGIESPDGALFRVLNSDGQVLISGNASELYKPFLKEHGISADMEVSSGVKAIAARSGPVLFVALEPGRSGWIYAALYPWESVTRSMGVLFRSLVAIGVLVAALSLIATFTYYRRAFRPLEDLTLYIHERIGDIVQDGEQLGYLEKAFRVIIHLNDDVRVKLEHVVPVFRERLLRRVALGEFADRGELEAELIFLDAHIPKERLFAAVLAVREKEAGVALYAARRIAETMFREMGWASFSAELDGRTGALAVAATSAELLRSLLIDLLQKIEQTLRSDIVIGFSEVPVDLVSFPTACSRARSAADYGGFVERGVPVAYEEIAGSEELSTYPEERERAIRNCLLECDQNGALSELDLAIKSIPRFPAALEQFTLLFSGALLSFVRELNMPINGIYPDGAVLARLTDFSSTSELRSYFRVLFERICAYLSTRRSARTDRYVERITAYIDAHFREGLSLETVAFEIGMSPAYLNRLLKAATGKTFVAALTERRLKEACDLMESGRDRIKEIAIDSGFASSKYFIAVFKEQKGCTPGAYLDVLAARRSANGK